MPDYLYPLAGVSLSEAAAEAAAIAPITRVLLDTLEFHRSTFVDELGQPTAIRIVCDKQDLLATLEATAPRNASEEVSFKAVALRSVRPNEGDSDESPSFTIELDAVSSELLELLGEDMESNEPVTMIHRIYASDDTAGPAVLPVLQMELVAADIGETSASLTCSFGDPLNASFPRVAYTRLQYPGLASR